MSNDYSVVLVITKDDKSVRLEDRKDWYAVVQQGEFIDDCLYDNVNAALTEIKRLKNKKEN